MRKSTITVFLAVCALILSSVTGEGAASGPPAISQQPQNQSVSSGTSVAFTAVADGSPPLAYQWSRNGFSLAGATNSTLLLSNVSFTQSGSYAVTINNSQGSLTSTSAFLLVDPQLTFRLNALRVNGAIVVPQSALTGSDRGGIAVSSSNVFVTGNSATARFGSEFLTGGTSLGAGTIYDGMVGDLKTETIYLLASGTNILRSPGGTADNLVQIDGATGAVTTNRIMLSTNIVLQNYGDIGLFSGYGRIVIHIGYAAYDIRMPSGEVTFLGYTQYLPHNYSQSWAYWGIAEYLGGNLTILFAQNGFPVTTISRARLPDGNISTAATFVDFRDLASFTFSTSLSRWYFHYQGVGQVGGSTETLGSAKGLYTTNSQFPTIFVPPSSTSAYPGSNAVFSVTAFGGGTLNYQWQFNGLNIPDATNSFLLISNVDTNRAGTYSVSVSNSLGGITSDEAFLTVITSPYIVINPQSRITYPGLNVTLSSFADGAPPLSYQWLFNGTELAGQTNTFLTLTNLLLSQDGAYSLLVSNAYGTAVSDPATLTVRGEPVVLSAPVARTINAGSGASFAVVADGAPPLRYQWLLNGTNIAGATNRTVTVSQAQPAQAGTYSVVVSNLYGTASASTTLTVTTVPTILSNPVDVSVILDDSVSFGVLANGPGPLRYQWRFNGTPIQNATNSSLTIPSIQASDIGSYTVLIFNSYGSILSQPAALSLFPIHPEGSTFRIASLTSNNPQIIAHNSYTGDDRGGIVSSLHHILLTGDSSSARFGLDLTNGLVLNQRYDSLAANLRNGKVYVLASNDVPYVYVSGGNSVVTHLLELNTSSGSLSGNRIALSAAIPFNTNGQCGIFSGFDRILFHNKTNVYGILLPSGTVTNYGVMASPSHTQSESWAYWGVAENFGGNTYITYVRNSTTISRTRVPDNVT
ncbi:MAG TPA: immunoglobulin domain-containing protein, partial [Candidatus Saccharimonadales bacterium]|nr:immunoglobulin domain-containing protein [Candidatus Saccharimonadales bacterium]